MKKIILLILILNLMNISCEDNDPAKNNKMDFHLAHLNIIKFGNDLNGCFGNKVSGGSDLWGYKAADGKLYALMGIKSGVAVVAIPEMLIIDTIEGPQDVDCFYHRDIKTFEHYAYIVSENPGFNAGMMILDLQYLPDSVHFIKSYVTDQDTMSHNISIDESQGFAYVQNRNGKIRIIDLNDPENPQDIGLIDALEVHDMFARNDTVWVAEGFNQSFAIFDLSDKSNPVLLKRILTNNDKFAYAHNIWPSEDGTIFATTEETPNIPIKFWQVENFNDINQVGSYLGSNNLAHDVKLFNNMAFISHYESGVIILDIADPTSPKLLGSYDTYPENNLAQFNGCWGVYPFVDDGYIISSNMSGTLNLLEFSR